MKKEGFNLVRFLMFGMFFLVLDLPVSHGQMATGQMTPAFSLKDLKGQSHDLSTMKDRPMLILYFFDVDSRPSQDGLLYLHQLSKQHKEASMTVWTITLSAREKVAKFVESTGITFPVLLDGAKVSDLYQARQILPTVCILWPGLKVLDYFQGRGKTTEIMLVRVAERELQRRQTKMAKAISDDLVKKNPQNVRAQTTKGYAALKEQNLKEAEEIFKEVAQKGGQGEILGKEGLATVYAKRGEMEKALQLAREVEQKAPERAYVHVVKRDLLYAQDKKKEAEVEYQKKGFRRKVPNPIRRPFVTIRWAVITPALVNMERPESSTTRPFRSIPTTSKEP